MFESKPQLRLVRLEINGVAYSRSIPLSMTLLDYLREELSLTGSKRGCDHGECGCCTVLIDGESMLACLVLAVEVQGRSILTIEGVADAGSLHSVQEAMVRTGAIQCGFCTPAMVMNAVGLLARNANPTRTQVKQCVSGTLCRCTGYTKIEEALLMAAEMEREKLRP